MPFHDDAAAVSLQAETGELLSMLLNYPSPPPVIASVKALLRQDQDGSRHLAAAHLGAARGVKETTLIRSELLMVQPNTYWVDGSVRPKRPVVVRPAWTFLLMEGQKAYAVWIDAETGKVIGGWEGGNLSNPPRPDHLPPPVKVQPVKPQPVKKPQKKAEKKAEKRPGDVAHGKKGK
jgi:hypothetical protein